MLDNESTIKETLDFLHTKSEDLLKLDPCYQHRLDVEWAEKRGLIRDLTPKEIQKRMDNNEWRKVNKIIIQNENRHNMATDTPADSN